MSPSDYVSICAGYLLDPEPLLVLHLHLKDELIDVGDADEKATEVDLDKKAEGGEVKDEKTKGGILLGDETIDRQQVASQCGNVIAMGDACYKDKERYPDGPWCKVGDWVIFARYAGSRIQIEGGEIRLLNEDEILATVKNPEDILHKY